MKYPVYCIRDLKVGFMSPTIDQSDHSAVRNFGFAINGDGIMNYSPKDFDLYKIGEFDSEKGTINGLKIPELICNGINLVGEDK